MIKVFCLHSAKCQQNLGSSEEVAEVVVWLCSDAASYITGQTILIDGGFAIPGFRN